MPNRFFTAPFLQYRQQMKYFQLFKTAHLSIRLKNRRICIVRRGDDLLYQFTTAHRGRKFVSFLPISEEAMDVMMSLKSGLLDREYIDANKTKK